MIPKTIAEKFLVHPSGCWLWTACVLSSGYGQVQFKGKRYPAHRVLYELLRGPIPSGLTLDHLCRNRSCVNPMHLEAVTNRENVLRGIGLSAVNAKKTSCKWGHLFTQQTTYYPGNGQRQCRICRARRNRYRRALLRKGITK